MTVDVSLTGRRVLVVGGSGGIGRASALSAAAAGAEITVVGRSPEKLAEVIATAGHGTAISADVREPSRCVSMVNEAVEAMGAFDVVLFATGITHLLPVGRVDPQTLQDIFAVNSVAPALVADAAVHHLTETGVMLFLSSMSAGTNYQGLGPYAASKAALERIVRAFQFEHPEHRFMCIAVGDTSGTDIARTYDVELTADLLPRWLASAVMYERQMEVADLGEMLVELTAMLLAHPGISVPEIAMVPPGPMRTGTMEDFMRSMAE
ncbi:MAG TPA: SDR family oxidoreductase [Acidimicrobiia bacterium]